MVECGKLSYEAGHDGMKGIRNGYLRPDSPLSGSVVKEKRGGNHSCPLWDPRTRNIEEMPGKRILSFDFKSLIVHSAWSGNPTIL